jgi:hypothetical protein
VYKMWERVWAAESATWQVMPDPEGILQYVGGLQEGKSRRRRHHAAAAAAAAARCVIICSVNGIEEAASLAQVKHCGTSCPAWAYCGSL